VLKPNGEEEPSARVDLTIHRPVLQYRWAAAISQSEWEIYQTAIKAVRETGAPFLLGGGFALATFTGRWRDTKDIDFYIHPEHREKVVEALSKQGFSDYFNIREYDRKWIHRNVRDGVIVDIIWAMANQRAQVDENWFSRAGSIFVRGENLQVIPVEEFVWAKLYIMQRDHCDWPDIFNVLCAAGAGINWDWLIQRLEEDLPLLKGALTVFGWLCPEHAAALPKSLWRKLGLCAPSAAGDCPKRDHIRLLDSRAWFAAILPEDRKLEV
jgi:hypothetical protein